MATLGNRIRELRNLSEKTGLELGNLIGVSKATISLYENDKTEPDEATKKKLCDIFNVSMDYLTGYSDVKHAPTAVTPRGVRIPVLGKVVAGIPIEAVEDIIDYEEIDEKLAKSGTFFALQIKGRSMEPTFHEGDVVIVRQQPEVENGEIAIVLVNGSEATVKEVKESSDGITLIGHNVAAYTPTFYSRQEVADLPVQIIGKVVELRRKF